MITDNTGPNSEVDTDAFHCAILQYRNTPDRDTKLSPPMCDFGRSVKDFIPILPGHYKPHDTWKVTLTQRESALRNHHMKIAEHLTEHTQRLPPLRVGDFVRIQKQTRSHPIKWDKTVRVIEVRQYDQYAIRVDGSGRITIENRKFLRHYTPVYLHQARQTTDTDFRSPLTCVPQPTRHTIELTYVILSHMCHNRVLRQKFQPPLCHRIAQKLKLIMDNLRVKIIQLNQCPIHQSYSYQQLQVALSSHNKANTTQICLSLPKKE